MKEDSVRRIELAQSLAPVYAMNPGVEAVYVFGSVAYGFADYYSDIELGVIWSQPPAKNELQTAAELACATEWEVHPSKLLM